MVLPLPSMTSTHWVLPSVARVSVRAAPCFAKTVPLAAVKVSAPPLNAALITEAAWATCIPPRTVARTATPTTAPRNGPRLGMARSIRSRSGAFSRADGRRSEAVGKTIVKHPFRDPHRVLDGRPSESQGPSHGPASRQVTQCSRTLGLRLHQNPHYVAKPPERPPGTDRSDVTLTR